MLRNPPNLIERNDLFAGPSLIVRPKPNLGLKRGGFTVIGEPPLLTLDGRINATVKSERALEKGLPRAERENSNHDKRHIVDVLIEERAPHLHGSIFWPILRPTLWALLGYRKARALADAIRPMAGANALSYVSNLMELEIDVQSLERIPRQGRVIVVANHPTGIADGVALLDALRRIRRDISFLANADAHRVCPGFRDNLIPVIWPPAKRKLRDTKATVRHVRDALEAERVVVIFAAGTISKRVRGKIRDSAWEDSVAAFARKHKTPIVPVYVSGPFPFLFHVFAHISTELRDITLFHELLNKRKRRFRLIFGELVKADAFADNDRMLTDRLKAYVEEMLPENPDAGFS